MFSRALLFIAIFSFLSVLMGVLPAQSRAYYTNMPANVVVGQQDFTSNSINQGGSTTASSVNVPSVVYAVAGKFFVVDQNNHRVLIYNTIPTTNNAAADVVIGQQNFTSGSANQGGSVSAHTLNSPFGIASDGQRLFIADSINNRILIYNSIPTSNNAAADVVIGQSNFTSNLPNQGGSRGANTLNQPRGITYYQGKLIVPDPNNSNRVLIFNTIPSSNNASADVVIGQVNFTDGLANQGGSPAANTLNGPRSATVFNGKLIIADQVNNRVLIYNSIPNVNNASADVVIGQQNFTTISANQGGSPGANTLNGPRGVFAIDNRLFINEPNSHRTLIYNTIPTSNNANANIVIGQSNFTSVAANQGGSPAANTLNGPGFGIFQFNNQLMITDQTNNRVLIYNNILGYPGISLNAAPETRANNLLRISGNTSTSTPYTIANVQYAINGGSFSYATASDGAYGGQSESFYFDFDPTQNQPRDAYGNVIGGFTAQVKSINNNTDVTDNTFFFSPFAINSSVDPSFSPIANPTFDFTVNGQRTTLRDNLQKYQIWIKPQNGDWQTLIDNIPVDFATVSTQPENKLATTYQGISTNNGNFETDQLYATYSNEAARIQVRSKTQNLHGIYEWKVVAVDQSGHGQETTTQTLFVGSSQDASFGYNFPLTISSFNLSTYSPTTNQRFTAPAAPVFNGIAFSGSTVTYNFLDQSCATNGWQLSSCLQSFTATTQPNSRYTLSVPTGKLTSGKKYIVRATVSLNQNYNQLPSFLLTIN